MTPEAQRITIAAACGHAESQYYEGFGWCSRDKDGRACITVPDYLNDLNAMHEAEKVLTEVERQVFGERLNSLTGAFYDDYYAGWCSGHAAYNFSHGDIRGGTRQCRTTVRSIFEDPWVVGGSVKIKTVEVEYIESGTFQGGEEDVSKARIKPGEECVVLKKADYEKLIEIMWRYGKTSANEPPTNQRDRPAPPTATIWSTSRSRSGLRLADSSKPGSGTAPRFTCAQVAKGEAGYDEAPFEETVVWNRDIMHLSAPHIK